MATSKAKKIRTIFIRRMALSACVQFVIIGMLLILLKNYQQHNEANTLAKDLLVSDDFTVQEIGSYKLLGNKYAIDLELHNIGDSRKLDSVFFKEDLSETKQLGNCTNLGNDFKLCKDVGGIYYGVSPIKYNNKDIGYIIAKKKYDSLIPFDVTHGLFLILITIFGGFLFNLGFLFNSMKRKIEDNTTLLLKFISSQHPYSSKVLGIDIEEYDSVAKKFSEERDKLTLLENEKANYEAKKSIAAQVSHDIRSPLAALEMMVSHIVQLPESQRNIIRGSVSTINDIANNLISEYEEINDDEESQKRSQPELIYLIVDSIVSEKRAQYFKRSIDLEFVADENSIWSFIKISSGKFKRVLSNLINNAAESGKPDGSSVKILIKLSKDIDKLKIEIIDNGRGIEGDLIPEIIKGGISVGKKGGLGLGVSHAVRCIEEWKGSYSIHTKLNEGTTFEINLPISQPPPWVLSKISLKPNTRIFVLDDDDSIHLVWHQRFESALNNFSHITIEDFYNTEEFIESFDINLKKTNANRYFIDYELFGSNMTGLEVIERLNLWKDSVLITSHYENPQIRKRCEDLGIKILPKKLAVYVPIEMEEDSKTDSSDLIVFLDDNKALTEVWKLRAGIVGKDIITFNKARDFINSISQYSKETVFYIDSELDGGYKGEEIAKTLYENGYENIYLSTGHEKSQFPEMPYIKSIIGKKPPF